MNFVIIITTFVYMVFKKNSYISINIIQYYSLIILLKLFNIIINALNSKLSYDNIIYQFNYPNTNYYQIYW